MPFPFYRFPIECADRPFQQVQGILIPSVFPRGRLSRSFQRIRRGLIYQFVRP